MMKEIVFEIGEKEIRLTEGEARALKADLDKLFCSAPYMPLEPIRYKDEFPVKGPMCRAVNSGTGDFTR